MMLAFSMATADFLLLVVIVAAAFYSFTGVHAGAACAPKERDALLAFRQGITSDPWGLLASWQPEDEHDCCQWEGVQCSNLTGHVLELHLRGGDLTGEISRSLLSLQHLEYVDVSMNSLQVPEFLGSFKNLRYLDLSSIPFSGRVPPQLGNLSKLHYLDLSNTILYSTDLSWLTHLPLLQYLDMGSVNLSMVTDWPYVVNMLPSLRVLILDDCSLASANQSLPRLNLTNLEELHLSFNSFQHPVASCWFWNLTSLVHLSLEGTELYGQLPSTLGDMVSLQVLDLSWNSNNLSMTTTNLKNLCNLTVLDLDLSLSYGNITELIERLPQCSSNKLQLLYLYSNYLVGFLPSIMGHLTSIVTLDLSWNNITGPLPAFIGHFAHLRILDLSFNHLTGHVPSEIGMLANLTTLDLSGNDLDGSITEEHLDGLRSLEFLNLANNHFEGELPQCLNMSNMVYLLLSNNSFSGNFPSFLRSCTSLSFLDLSWNRFSGTLPMWIGSCSSLQSLLLNNNMFYGHIPNNITSLTNIYHLNLAANWISGVIPPHLSNQTYMTRTFILDNEFLIDTKGQQLNYHGAPVLEKLSIDLSSNLLTGKIPDGITSLDGLVNLNLSWNQLNGEVPDKIGAMQSLESLDLSNNNLFGEIPSSISNLTFLSILDLSYNNLTGRIPSGRQP